MKSFIRECEEEQVEYICTKYRTKYCYEECNWFGNCPDLERGDDLKWNEAICSNCGAVHPKSQMVSISPGRRPQLFCQKCYSRAMLETSFREYDRKRKKLHEKGRKQ